MRVELARRGRRIGADLDSPPAAADLLLVESGERIERSDADHFAGGDIAMAGLEAAGIRTAFKRGLDFSSGGGGVRAVDGLTCAFISGYGGISQPSTGLSVSPVVSTPRAALSFALLIASAFRG